MWMLVMFDLPVLEKAERKAASAFRNTLLDLGFEMSQFSVYLRFCTSQAQLDTLCKSVEQCLPEGGKVHVLQFTEGVQIGRAVQQECRDRSRMPSSA